MYKDILEAILTPTSIKKNNRISLSLSDKKPNLLSIKNEEENKNIQPSTSDTLFSGNSIIKKTQSRTSKNSENNDNSNSTTTSDIKCEIRIRNDLNEDQILISSSDETFEIKKKTTKSNLKKISQKRKKSNSIRNEKKSNLDIEKISEPKKPRRKLTKSTNLKTFSANDLPKEQKQITNFFQSNKNENKITYFDTFEKSSINNFKVENNKNICDINENLIIELNSDSDNDKINGNLKTCNEIKTEISRPSSGTQNSQNSDETIGFIVEKTEVNDINDRESNSITNSNVSESDKNSIELNLKSSFKKNLKLKPNDITLPIIENVRSLRSSKRLFSNGKSSCSSIKIQSSSTISDAENIDYNQTITNSTNTNNNETIKSFSTQNMNTSSTLSSTISVKTQIDEKLRMKRNGGLHKNVSKKLKSYKTRNAILENQNSDTTTTLSDIKSNNLNPKRIHSSGSDISIKPIPKVCKQLNFQLDSVTTDSLSTENNRLLINTKSETIDLTEIDDEVNPEIALPKNLRNTNKNLTKNRKPMKKNIRKRIVNCPSYKIIENTTFAVDAFRFGEIEGITHYFLTHFHCDHYIGLKKTFSKPIYLSEITAKLVEEFIRTNKKYINIIELEGSTIVNDVEITAIDANHCPGAVMFLFKFLTGRCILHTGDFRASPEMEQNPLFWNHTIDTIYLDTTYLSNRYAFKSQHDSITEVLHLIDEFRKKYIGEKILYICGSYVIGKEKFWLKIAEHFNFRVWTNGNRLKALYTIRDENIIKHLTVDPKDAQMHILTMNHLFYNHLSQYLEQYKDDFDIIFAIRPSGWEKNAKPRYGRKINIIGIEYSEHSSYSELRRFVRFLQPKNLISTVPMGNDQYQTTPIPKSWLENDLKIIRNGFQSSITNYIQLPQNSSLIQKSKISSCSIYDDLEKAKLINSCEDLGMLDATCDNIGNQSINNNDNDDIKDVIPSIGRSSSEPSSDWMV